MSPDIPTGALALAQTVPAAEVAVGAVVSVPRADGVRVTHRVVETDDAGGASRSLVLQGDANPVIDPDPVVVAVADRVFWSTPRLGEWVDQALAPGWVFVIGTLFGMLAMVGFRRPRAEGLAANAHDPAHAGEGRAVEARAGHEDGPRHAAGRHRTSGTAGTAVVSTVVALALAAALTAAPTEPTLAAFADTARATATATTGTVATASALGCSGGGTLSSPTLTWTPAPDATIPRTGWQLTRNGIPVGDVLKTNVTSKKLDATLLTLGGRRTVERRGGVAGERHGPCNHLAVAGVARLGHQHARAGSRCDVLVARLTPSAPGRTRRRSAAEAAAHRLDSVTG